MQAFSGRASQYDVGVPVGVDELIARYPVDDRCRAYLLASAPQVIDRTVQMFKPPREGEADYSGLLTTYVKKMRQTMSNEVMEPTATNDELQRMVDEFMIKYPIDESAYNFLMGCLPDVMQKVMKEFVPRREGEADYSALFMTFAKKKKQETAQAQPMQAGMQFARHGMSGQVSGLRGGAPQDAMTAAYMAGARDAGLAPHGVSGQRYSGMGAPASSLTPVQMEDIEDFRARYPIDDRCVEYFFASSVEAQHKVLREFQAKREGEADYSGLFMSFVKRCRSACGNGPSLGQSAPGPVGSANVGRGGPAWQVPAATGPGYGGHQGYGPCHGGGGAFSAAGARGGGGGRGVAQATDELERMLEDFRAAYPIEDGAFAMAVSDACDRVLARSRHGYGEQRGMAFGSNPPPADAGVRTSAADGTPWMGQQAGDLDQELQSMLHHFLTRFPVDDRCVEYLTRSSPQVVHRVVTEFVPKTEGDADYSAIVMSFTKRVKEQVRLGLGGEPAPKRARPF